MTDTASPVAHSDLTVTFREELRRRRSEEEDFEPFQLKW